MLNNRPLTYIGDDIQFPLLTQNLLVLGQAPIIPNKDPTGNENKDARKWHGRVEK